MVLIRKKKGYIGGKNWTCENFRKKYNLFLILITLLKSILAKLRVDRRLVDRGGTSDEKNHK